MHPRSVRLWLACACAVACSVVCVLPGAASGRLTIGISDNLPAMFSQSSFMRLHVPVARVGLPWNSAIMRDRRWVQTAQVWLNAARAANVEPMVSFTGNGNFIPSVRLYSAAIKAFLHRFPSVQVYTPWNEPDWIYRSLGHNPALAAGYFNALVRWCHRCTVVAGDFYRPASELGRWVQAYRRALHHRPVAWALHPYDDVRTHTTAQIRTLARLTSGQVWLDEISGVERRGHWPYPNQSPAAADRDERFLFSLPARFPRITRIYHYEWQAPPWPYWDSGLLGPQGKPRPAYWTFASALVGHLPGS